MTPRALAHLAIPILMTCCAREASAPLTPVAAGALQASPTSSASNAVIVASPTKGADLPQFIGRPETELRAAVAQQLGLAVDADIRARGIEVVVRHDVVDTIFVHLVPEGGSGPVYDGPLFRGVTRAMRVADVERLFGPPDARAKPTASPKFPNAMHWISYRRPEAQIHFQFADDDGTIEMITLMRPDWKPGDH